MKVKKILFILGVSFFLGGLFSCANGNGPGLEEPKGTTSKYLSINMSAFESLAISESEVASKSVARSATSEKMLVKILEDGSIENFINVPEDADLGPVSFVTQSPAENSKEIYVVLDWEFSYLGWENGKTIGIGQVLCIYEDGSYYDILSKGDGTWMSLCNNGTQDKPIRFDGQGNMYYQVWEGSGNRSMSMIYKFDPNTKKSTQLTAQVEDTWYEDFYVSEDGNWLFVKANRYTGNSSVHYLRAIPVSDANNPVNLFYDSTGSSWVNEWIYDENSKNIYYSKDGGLYKFPYKDGTYSKDNRELVLGYEENNNSYFDLENLLLEYRETYIEPEYEANFRGRAQSYDLEKGEGEKYYYFIDSSDEETINYDQIVKYLFAELIDSLIGPYRYTFEYDENGNGITKYIDYSKEYEIRFDTFAEVEGFEILATETKDSEGKSLKNEDIFKALVEKNLLGILGKLFASERYAQNKYDSYTNNFFADIMYNIETGEKIDDELFFKDDIDCFVYYFYSYELLESFSNGGFYGYAWDLKSDFLKEDGTVDSAKVLATFAECCGDETIDFSLEFFENCENETLRDLYTTEKNEGAIEFLVTEEKIPLFIDAIIYYRSEFLTYTCFLPGTDTPAYGSLGNNSVDIWGLSDFVFIDNALYANRYGREIVLLIDNNGNPVGKTIELGLDNNPNSNSTISSSLVYGNSFYFQKAILDSMGEEVGAHKIYRFDTKSSNLEDMFYNMPNNTTYEVISYTVGGQNLYCCLNKGIELKTVKIDINTKEFTEIASGTKLTQIIVVK